MKYISLSRSPSHMKFTLFSFIGVFILKTEKMSCVFIANLFTLGMVRSLCLQRKLLKETIKRYEKIYVAYVTAKYKCFYIFCFVPCHKVCIL